MLIIRAIMQLASVRATEVKAKERTSLCNYTKQQRSQFNAVQKLSIYEVAAAKEL
jgi:hypothetical protein